MKFKKSRHIMAITLITGSGLMLNACGKGSDVAAPFTNNLTPPSVQNAGKIVAYNSNTRWQTLSVKCDGQTQVIDPATSYRLDSSSLVRIDLISEDEASLCRSADLFTRIPSVGSSSTYDGFTVDSEEGILKSSAGKNVCYAKVNGQQTQKILSTTLHEATNVTTRYRLVMRANHASLSLEKTLTCTGVSEIELSH